MLRRECRRCANTRTTSSRGFSVRRNSDRQESGSLGVDSISVALPSMKMGTLPFDVGSPRTERCSSLNSSVRFCRSTLTVLYGSCFSSRASHALCRQQP